MQSSRSASLALLVLAALFVWSPRARAQQPAQGFAVDRLYPSAAGGGWIVMDTLDTRGRLGGAVALTTWYAHDPLRVRTNDGSQRLTVVSDEAMAGFAFAATYDRWKVSLNLDMPLAIGGNGGTVGAYRFTAPNSGQPFTPSGVDLSTASDAFADARLGVDVRLLGTAGSAFRMGAGAQLLVSTPNTLESEYLTDGALRAMARVLFAGDADVFSYAGHLGVHVRPRDDSPAPGGPQGSELLFGVAAGPRLALGDRKQLAPSQGRRSSVRPPSGRSSGRAAPASRGSCLRVSRERPTMGPSSGSSSVPAPASTRASAHPSGASSWASSSSIAASTPTATA